MEQRLQRYLQGLAGAVAQLDNRIAALAAQGRQDEANLEKVHRNVLEIFATLARADAALARQQADPAAAFARLHPQRFETIPAPWRQRQQKAAAHGDVVARIVEETKLKAAKQVWQLYEETEAEA